MLNKENMKLHSKELSELPTEKSSQILAVFSAMANTVSEFEDEYNLIMKDESRDKDASKRARKLRLSIAKIRQDTEKARKSQKAEILLAGKAIDGIANILKWSISEKETSLLEIEKHAENIEKERLEKLQEERVLRLEPYFDSASQVDLSSMDSDVFEAYFSAKVTTHNKAIEAEREAEAKLAAEKAENDRLLAEAKRVEAKLAAIEAEKRAEAKKTAEKLAAIEAAKKKEKQEAEAKLAAATKAAEAKLEAEREKAAEAKRMEAKKHALVEAKLAAAAKAAEAKLTAERKKIEEAEAKRLAAVEADLQKGDSDKIQDLCSDLESLKTKYTFSSNAAKKIYAGVVILLSKIIAFIIK